MLAQAQQTLPEYVSGGLSLLPIAVLAAVRVSLDIARNVEGDHRADGGDVQTACSYVRCNEKAPEGFSGFSRV